MPIFVSYTSLPLFPAVLEQTPAPAFSSACRLVLLPINMFHTNPPHTSKVFSRSPYRTFNFCAIKSPSGSKSPAYQKTVSHENLSIRISTARRNCPFPQITVRCGYSLINTENTAGFSQRIPDYSVLQTFSNLPIVCNVNLQALYSQETFNASCKPPSGFHP